MVCRRSVGLRAITSRGDTVFPAVPAPPSRGRTTAAASSRTTAASRTRFPLFPRGAPLSSPLFRRNSAVARSRSDGAFSVSCILVLSPFPSLGTQGGRAFPAPPSPTWFLRPIIPPSTGKEKDGTWTFYEFSVKFSAAPAVQGDIRGAVSAFPLATAGKKGYTMAVRPGRL